MARLSWLDRNCPSSQHTYRSHLKSFLDIVYPGQVNAKNLEEYLEAYFWRFAIPLPRATQHMTLILVCHNTGLSKIAW